MRELASTRNLSDNALAYLQARPGKEFENADIAHYFAADPKVLRPLLGKLADAGKINEVVRGKRRKYFVRKLAPAAEPRQPRITHKVYALPAVMAERGREIQSDRAAFPSRHI
jgi:hypothetical protein